MADVGDGHGVAAVDAFARELADEVAEEKVDCFGRGEVFQVTEQFRGGSVVMTLFAVLELASVMGAEFQIGTRSGKTALLAAAIHVVATIEG